MLHIILGILKVIGLILGILLLLFLAFLLAVIFVPVRYRITARVQDGEYTFSARGSWMLHLISAAAIFDSDGERVLQVRLFGIRLPLSGAEERRRAEPRQEKKNKKKKNQDGKKGKRQKRSGEEPNHRMDQKPGQEQKTGTDSAGQAAFDATRSTAADDAKDLVLAQGLWRKIWFQCKGICDKIKKILQILKRLWHKLVHSGERAADLLQKLFDLAHKPGELLALAEEYELREVFGRVAGHLIFLLRHYRPRRIEGYLRFGAEDPSATGQLTGLIYLLLPARADRFSVEPIFSESFFETETMCSGRIRMLHVLRVLWRGFRDRKLRRLITEFVAGRT